MDYVLLSFFHCSGDHRDLHSFPTRRSSDLVASPANWRVKVGEEETSAVFEPAPASAGGALFICAHGARSEEHTSELQSHVNLVCRLLLEKKKCSTAVSVALFECGRTVLSSS